LKLIKRLSQLGIFRAIGIVFIPDQEGHICTKDRGGCVQEWEKIYQRACSRAIRGPKSLEKSESFVNSQPEWMLTWLGDGSDMTTRRALSQRKSWIATQANVTLEYRSNGVPSESLNCQAIS
jgi:hypothetical protein